MHIEMLKVALLSCAMTATVLIRDYSRGREFTFTFSHRGTFGRIPISGILPSKEKMLLNACVLARSGEDGLCWN